MNKIFLAFKDKRLRYGAFSTLTVVFVIAILVIVNLLAAQLDISYDLSRDKLYSISDRTKTALADIDADVTIYSLLQTGMTNEYFDVMRALLDEYPRISPRIRLEYKDPYLYPQFVESYREEGQDIPVGSVIVEGAGRVRVIPVTDLVTEQMDYQTWQSYVSSIDVEPQVTNAILHVLGGETPVIYALRGHNEQPVPEEFSARLATANYELRELSLFNAEAVPEDCGLLFITTPARDWSAEEAALVEAYLTGGGRAVFFLDFMNATFANMEGVLTGYGLELVQGLVFEGDADRYFQGNPMYLIPALAEHEITGPVREKGYPNIVPFAMAIKESEMKRRSVGIAPLLGTSESAYAKTNMDSQSINKEPGDVDGPFILSAAIEEYDFAGVERATKIVVTTAGSILDASIDSVVMGANYDFVLSCINWTQDAASQVYISPKTTSAVQLMMTAGQAFTLIGVSLLVPVVILLFGFGVWFRRKRG